MSAELIQVDFQKGQVRSRRQLPEKDAPPADAWKALKDPDFKEWVKGVAATAEACAQSGGDWRRMIMIMADQPPGEDEFCITVWDNNTIQSGDVIDILSLSLGKVTDAMINEADQP